MTTIDITDEMIAAFTSGAATAGTHPPATRTAEVTRAGLSAVLNDPAVRQAVLDAVNAEHADMIRSLPRWNDLSDLDKGAALMHLAKCENEGRAYAAEHYPAEFIDDPRLTALDPDDACDHALSMEDDRDRLDDDELVRLYDLALHHKRDAA
ncbi:hypothetical protein [Catenuloplanes japonicus]|uniref:hypothetical protein n=1 Tax=Catenuloplanes japonicus TaxID=33876 RepID=UPI0005271AEE|nr:hypothetical protein [Catenuloplanes japonicus]